MFTQNFHPYIAHNSSSDSPLKYNIDAEYISPLEGVLIPDENKAIALRDQLPVIACHADFLSKKASGCWGAFGARLIEKLQEYDRLFFFDKLSSVEVKIGACSPAAGYGQFKPQGDHGILNEITINDSLFNKSGKHTIIKDFDDPHSFLLLADILLHQAVHAYVSIEFGSSETGYDGHGPLFANECNRIGSIFGFPEVFVRTNATRRDKLKLCKDWPYNVRDENYYGGLLREPNDDSKKLDIIQDAVKSEVLLPAKVSKRKPTNQEMISTCQQIYTALRDVGKTTKSRGDFFWKLVAEFRCLYGMDGLDHFPAPLIPFNTPKCLGSVPVTVPE